jgi:lipoyl(octanoyl) transferase
MTRDLAAGALRGAPLREGLVVRTRSIGYREAVGWQRRLARARERGEIPDVIWLLEHPPTFTTGRHGRRDDLFLSDEALAAAGADVVAVDRGGQMTWHGPGQSVVYAICDLRPGGRVRAFVRALVEAMRDAAGVPGALPDDGAMGLYVEGRKLGSVGIRVQGGVTTHGLALNRDPDLDWFRVMTACGAPGVPATSIAAEGGDPDRARVEEALAASLAARLGLATVPARLDEMGVAPPGASDQGRSDSHATSAAAISASSAGSAPSSARASASSSEASAKGSASGNASRSATASDSGSAGGRVRGG